MKKSGFLTIAYGEYYHKLAENLILSYRFNVPKEKQLPFAVIADKNAEAFRDFDEVIVVPPLEVGFMNKLMIEELSPYDETIFIDADCLVYGDISTFFDEYRNCGSLFSSFGRNIPRSQVAEINNILFDISKVEHLGDGATVPHFNAATYYCVKGSGVCETAKNLYYEKTNYGYPFWGDEPYIALAMWIHGCHCCSYEGSVYFGSHTKILTADILNSRFSAESYGRNCTGELLHWSTMKTHSPLYMSEVYRLKNHEDPSPSQLLRFRISYAAYIIRLYMASYSRALFKKIRRFLKCTID